MQVYNHADLETQQSYSKALWVVTYLSALCMMLWYLAHCSCICSLYWITVRQHVNSDRERCEHTRLEENIFFLTLNSTVDMGQEQKLPTSDLKTKRP